MPVGIKDWDDIDDKIWTFYVEHKVKDRKKELISLRNDLARVCSEHSVSSLGVFHVLRNMCDYAWKVGEAQRFDDCMKRRNKFDNVKELK